MTTCDVKSDANLCEPHCVSLLFLSFEWNAIRLDGPAHGIVTKTVHRTLPRGGMGQGVGV